MIATSSTPERHAARLRVHACWRVLFAIVALLDFYCFCYCHYYEYDLFGDNSAAAIAKKSKTFQPRSCPNPRGRKQKNRKLHHRRHPRQSDQEDDAEADTGMGNSTAITRSQEKPWSVSFQKQHTISSMVWQSMAFHHHPIHDKHPIASDTNSSSRKRKKPPEENKIYLTFLTIHLGFGLLCGIETILRAKKVRRVVLENKLIAAFEEHIASTVAKANRQRLLLAKNGQFSYTNLTRSIVGKTIASISSSSIATGQLKRNLYLPSLKSFYSSSKDSTAPVVDPNNQQVVLGKKSSKNENDIHSIRNATRLSIPSSIATGQLNHRLYLPSLAHTYSSNEDSTDTTADIHIQQEAFEKSSKNDESDTRDDGHTKDGDKNKNERNDGHHHDNDEVNTDNNQEAANKKSIILFLRSTFGLWLPIGITCIFWLSLLPLQSYIRIFSMLFHKYFDYNTGSMTTQENESIVDEHFCDFDCSNPQGPDATAACYLEMLGEDTAFATLWITNFVVRWVKTCEEIQEYLVSAVWKKYILGDYFRNHANQKLHKILLDHKQLHAVLFDRPKLVWFRLGRFFNIIKLVRFAGPLARMALKLNDQLLAGYSTFRKVRSARTNREQRLQRPSLLLQDLRRLESFHKLETTIAAWPSQCSMLLETLSKEASQFSLPTKTLSPGMTTYYAEEFLRKTRERGQQITKQIEWLQQQIKKGFTEFSPSEFHDRIVRLSKDLSKRNLFSVYDNKDTESKNGIVHANSPRSHHTTKNRWWDFLNIGNLLSSRDWLISPRSRFSVVWRITVTNCLLLELTRLSVSWHLTQTFHLSITQVISRLFIDCGTIEEDTKRKFRFFTDLIEEWHAGISRAIPLVPFPKKSLWILCVPTSWSSKLLLLLGSALETFIDVVSFLDIFFWFFTGDLDPSTGIVIPKPFFSRCILPGTLVQIIDHPTLPNVLPSLLANLAVFATELGWSRLVLWSCALVPALVNEFFMPASAYFFRHLEESDDGDDGESVGNNDLLMTYAESFGYLPTRSTQTLERTMTPLLLRGNPKFHVDVSEAYSSNDEDDDGNDDEGGDLDVDDGDINQAFLRTYSFGYHQSRVKSGILSAPGSPRRTALRGSNVRFANDVSTEFHEDGDDSPPLFGMAADFDIGLSLSSHDLHDLHNSH